MSTLADDFAAFAQSKGFTVRQGPAPRRPAPQASMRPFEKPTLGEPKDAQRIPTDPFLDYTDDYTVWKQGQ